VSDEALEWAQSAAEGTTAGNASTPHPLATLYAELDRPTAAYQTILKAIGSSEDGEPQSHDWNVFGRMAETYGELEAAREYYSRIEPPDDAFLAPQSTVELSRRRIAALDAVEKTGEAGPVPADS